ncbi:MAG: GtrA family protein [Kiritimatiellae bacterium]|nr:GtrA family protein [Kiritimatiellia bacterium]
MTKLVGQIVRYYTVGAASAATDLLTYFVLTRLAGLHPLAANLISRPLGGVLGFVLNKCWTFRGRGHSTVYVQFSRFCVVWLSSWAASETLVGLFHELLRLGPMPAKLGAEAAVGLAVFVAQRQWTFK